MKAKLPGQKIFLAACLISVLVICTAPSMQAQDAAKDAQNEAEALKAIRESLRLVQERQADMGADMTTLSDQIRKLRGDLEEMGGNPERRKSDLQEMQIRLDGLSARMRVVENLVGAGELKPSLKDREANQANVQSSKAVKEEKPDMKELYFEAYNDFKNGKIEVARGKFQMFLKQFPNAPLVDGAQFYIGECYYVQGNYKQAILEYDMVIKNYPKGERVPHALLKQGLSFQKLGDKTGARILLEKLVLEYPDTHQAGIARTTLATLK
jgi:tol-pal system protein YbgF